MTANATLPPQTPLIHRIRRHQKMEHYYRLAGLVMVTNVIIAYFALQQWQWFESPLSGIQHMSEIILYNFSLAILMRQQYVVNALFKLATCTKTALPLWVRWRLGKIYHLGGVHSGAAMSGTAWFVGMTSFAIYHYMNGASIPLTFVITLAVLVALLSLIVFIAMPFIRGKHHDLFERTHRFGGWSALALFYVLHVQLLIQSNAIWYQESATWLIAIITFSIVLPWLRLRKVPVNITKPSNHAVIAEFDYGVTPFPGSSMALSHSPLMEWHSFANICTPNKTGFRLAISRAGDWTGDFIDNPPSHVWVKGIPTAGVANIEVLFKRVVYIATGSGIGPVLPHLLAKQLPMHLVWTTRNARTTYGDELVDEILAAEPNANIYDTDAHGKPDMVQLAYQAYKDFDAEAVIIISNQKLTQQVVYGLESRGIPAFGAIWDS